MHHPLMSENDGKACIVCGAWWREDSEPLNDCSGRTDLHHDSSDWSAHSLDNCDTYDREDACEHIACLPPINCDCDACKG